MVAQINLKCKCSQMQNQMEIKRKKNWALWKKKKKKTNLKKEFMQINLSIIESFGLEGTLKIM